MEERVNRVESERRGNKRMRGGSMERDKEEETGRGKEVEGLEKTVR